MNSSHSMNVGLAQFPFSLSPVYYSTLETLESSWTLIFLRHTGLDNYFQNLVFLTCGSQISSVGITWEIVRKSEFWALAQNY